MAIDHIFPTIGKGYLDKTLLQRETVWIYTLKTVLPGGMNEQLSFTSYIDLADIVLCIALYHTNCVVPSFHFLYIYFCLPYYCLYYISILPTQVLRNRTGLN